MDRNRLCGPEERAQNILNHSARHQDHAGKSRSDSFGTTTAGLDTTNIRSSPSSFRVTHDRCVMVVKALRNRIGRRELDERGGNVQ